MIAIGPLITAQNPLALGAPGSPATITLAFHLTDEARHDFLGWYNPRALQIIRGAAGAAHG
jgi:hypothetical protein